MQKDQIRWVVFGFILIAMMATNPSLEDHRQAVIDEIMKGTNNSKANSPDNDWEKLGTEIGKSLGKTLINNLVRRENYLLFSLTKISIDGTEKNVGIGIFGKVWIFNHDNKQEQTFIRVPSPDDNSKTNADSSKTGSSDISDISSDTIIRKQNNISSSNSYYGTWIGTQDGFDLKNKNGELIKINDNIVKVPQTKWKFIINSNGTVAAEQENSLDHSIVNYKGSGADNAQASENATIIFINLSSANNGSNFRLSLRFSDNNNGFCSPFGLSNGPEFIITKK